MNAIARRTLLAVAAAGALGLGGPVACATPTATPAAVAAQVPAELGDVDPRGVPRIAAEWAEAWNGADPQRLAALFTDDARYTDHAFGPTFTGRDGVATWAAMTGQGVGGLTATVDSAFRSGDQVSVRWTFGGHLAGAPTPFSVPVATVLQLRGDKIVSNDDFYNLAEVLRQSGLPADTTFEQP